MKIFSLEYLIDEASEGLKRFPSALGIAALGTFILMYAIDKSSYNEHLIKLVFAAWIGFSFQLACYLAFPDKKWAHFPGFVVWFITYFLMGDLNRETDAIRIFILGLFTHLCVSVAPYLKKESNTLDFWYFNLLIFQRIILSAAFSFIIAIGISLAFVSLDALFGIEVGYRIYPKIWILSFGLFNTWMFLGGIPNIFNFNIQDNDYPRHFELLTKFVLLPLVLLYLAILYAYIFKIGLQMELPRGWVTWLFLLFSIAGIFTFLLIWPLADDHEQSWIQKYARFFYIALVPLLLVEYVAIATRVGQYGITENRFFVLVLSLWLNGLVVYFALLKGKNIRIIPMSLAVVALLNVTGPWSAFSVAYRSQMNRLTTFLTEANLLNDGKITPKLITSDSLQKEIKNIVYYLGQNHDLNEIVAMFPKNIQDSLLKKQSNEKRGKWEMIADVNKQLGTENAIQENEKNIYFTMNYKQIPALQVKGFDEIRPFLIHSYDNILDSSISLQAENLKITYVFENQKYTIDLSQSFEKWVNRYQDSLAKNIENNRSSSSYTALDNFNWTIGEREFSGTQNNHRYKLYILSANIEKTIQKNQGRETYIRKVDNVQGIIMLHKK